MPKGKTPTTTDYSTRNDEFPVGASVKYNVGRGAGSGTIEAMVDGQPEMRVVRTADGKLVNRKLSSLSKA